MSWYQGITLITLTLCGVFVAIILALPSQNKAKHASLVGYIACIGIAQTIDLACNTTDPLHRLLQPLLYLLGPLLYTYVRQNSAQGMPSSRLLLVIFSPAAILLILNVIDLFSVFTGYSLVFLGEAHIDILSGYLFYELLFVWLSLRCLSASLECQSWSADLHQPDRLIWLRRLCRVDAAILLLELLLEPVAIWLGWEELRGRSIVVAILFAALILVSFAVIRQPHIIYTREAQVARPKYIKSGLGKDSSQFFQNKLDGLMVKEKLYLDSELTLSGLAQSVGLNSHNLSQLLNETFQQTYHEYINTLRIEHAKELLADSDYNIIDIGFHSGFSNKASFYNAFRKATNQAPGQWRKNCQSCNNSQPTHPGAPR